MTEVTTNIPDWAQGSTPELSAPPKKRAVKPVTPAASRTDQERIAEARAKAILWSKNSNPFGNHESWWIDYAGENTSMWDAERWAMLAELLETQILKTFKYAMGNHYNTATGEYVSKANVPFLTLPALKSAVRERIKELGLSEPLIWEWFSVPHLNDDFGRQLDRESFEQRILRFKQSSVGQEQP